MKRLPIIAAFALLLASPAPAQKNPFSYGIGEPRQPKVDHTLDQLVAARERLIRRYVLDKHYAWGVSVSGAEDVFTGDDNSWLTVYLYKDSVAAFAADFDQFATKSRVGSLTVDGITVVVQVIPRPKSKSTRNKINVQPKSVVSQQRADDGESGDGEEDFSEIC
jgi:hypothetical protein